MYHPPPDRFNFCEVTNGIQSAAPRRAATRRRARAPAGRPRRARRVGESDLLKDVLYGTYDATW